MARASASEELADAGAVAAQQVLLERSRVTRVHPVVNHLAEPGIHPVDGHALGGKRLEAGTARRHALKRGVGERDAAIAAADRGDVIDCQAVPVEQPRPGAERFSWTIHADSPFFEKYYAQARIRARADDRAPAAAERKGMPAQVRASISIVSFWCAAHFLTALAAGIARVRTSERRTSPKGEPK